MEGKKTKKRKSPNVYVIFFVAYIIVAVLTWIIPGGSYKLNEAGQAIRGTYQPTVANPQGIWEILMAPIIGMIGDNEKGISGAINISLNVMIFGSFLEMINRTGTLSVALKQISNKYKNNYKVLITVLVFAMSALGTIYGAYEECFVYLMMFMPMIMGMNMDSITAIMIVVLGSASGNLSSVVNPYSSGVASSIAGIAPGDGLLYRALIFVVINLVVSLFIINHASKVMTDPKKSPQYYRRDKDLEEFSDTSGKDIELTGNQKVIFRLFILTFIILIAGLIPWTSLNKNWTFFIDFKEWLGNVPILGNLIGKSLTPLGTWFFNEMNVLLMVMTFIIGKIHGFELEESINIFIKGAADLTGTAFVIPMARGIQVLMTYGNITSTILHFGEVTLAHLPPVVFVISCFVFYYILASFIPSSTGLAAATISIMAPLSVFAGLKEVHMIFIFNAALGLVKMIMPTSISVMTCTQMAHVDYATWIKTIKKPWIVTVLVTLVLLVASVFIF